jgi:hypothetical protein
VHLQALGSGGRRPSLPQLLDEAVGRHDLVAVQEQEGEQRPPLVPADSDGASRVDHLQRTE